MFNKQFEESIKDSITNIQSLLTINFDNPHLRIHKITFDDFNKPYFEVHIQNTTCNKDTMKLNFEQLSYYLKHPKDLIVYYYKERYVDYIECLKLVGWSSAPPLPPQAFAVKITSATEHTIYTNTSC